MEKNLQRDMPKTYTTLGPSRRQYLAAMQGNRMIAMNPNEPRS
jgi:hypothetical protein